MRMLADICMIIIALTTLVGFGCVIFGAADYHDTMDWMKQQEEYLKEMEKNKA